MHYFSRTRNVQSPTQNLETRSHYYQHPQVKLKISLKCLRVFSSLDRLIFQSDQASASDLRPWDAIGHKPSTGYKLELDTLI